MTSFDEIFYSTERYHRELKETSVVEKLNATSLLEDRIVATNCRGRSRRCCVERRVLPRATRQRKSRHGLVSGRLEASGAYHGSGRRAHARGYNQRYDQVNPFNTRGPRETTSKDRVKADAFFSSRASITYRLDSFG